MKLPLSQIQPYLSAYLSDGWRQDEFTLSDVDVEPGQITAQVHVEAYFMPGDGTFHFTVPQAFIWVAQLAIVYACWEHNLDEKPGEVYLREINLQCRRTITTETIDLLLTYDAKRYLPDSVYYMGEIDVGSGAFVGSGKFIIPLPQEMQNNAAANAPHQYA